MSADLMPDVDVGIGAEVMPCGELVAQWSGAGGKKTST